MKKTTFYKLSRTSWKICGQSEGKRAGTLDFHSHSQAFSVSCFRARKSEGSLTGSFHTGPDVLFIPARFS